MEVFSLNFVTMHKFFTFILPHEQLTRFIIL